MASVQSRRILMAEDDIIVATGVGYMLSELSHRHVHAGPPGRRPCAS